MRKHPSLVCSMVWLATSLVIATLAGCGSHTYYPYWKQFPVKKGVACHNEGSQQTAFDNNSDGRIDRLRYWRGSGIARELLDRNNDGWFDTLVVIVYDNERSRTDIRIRAPHFPKEGTNMSFDIPELLDKKP